MSLILGINVTTKNSLLLSLLQQYKGSAALKEVHSHYGHLAINYFILIHWRTQTFVAQPSKSTETVNMS